MTFIPATRVKESESESESETTAKTLLRPLQRVLAATYQIRRERDRRKRYESNQTILSSVKLAATSATRNGCARLQKPKFESIITASRRWTTPTKSLLLTSVKTIKF